MEGGNIVVRGAWPVRAAESSIQAYERLLPTIRDVVPGRSGHMTMDVVSVVVTAVGVLRALRPLRAELLRLYDFDVLGFDDLGPRAQALQHANAVYVQAVKRTPLPAALVSEARELRDLLRTGVRALQAAGLMGKQSLGRLRRRAGTRSLVLELQVLTLTYQQHWQAVQHRTAVRESDLSRAVWFVDTLSMALVAQKLTPENVADARLVRRQAYALLFQTYTEVCAAVHYVRRKHGDGEQLAPSLYFSRKAPKRVKAKAAPEAVMPLEAQEIQNNSLLTPTV